MLNFLKSKEKAQKTAPEPIKKSAPGAVGRHEVETGSSTAKAPEVKRKIMVVGKGATFTTAVMDYATSLAQRLGYDLIAMNVNPALEQMVKMFSPYNQHMRAKFVQQAGAAWALIEPELQAQGIHGEHTVKFEDVAVAVKALNHEIKRIDFVITDAGITAEDITGEIPLPVFSITGNQGEQIMAHEPQKNRGKLLGKTVALGVAAAGLYAAVFLNSGTVMQYFTKGGWYAAMPIATVFAISFVHGAFAHNLWSLLGIEASKKTQPRVAPSRPVTRKRPRPQLRLNA
jgi:hypothetical protein